MLGYTEESLQGGREPTKGSASEKQKWEALHPESFVLPLCRTSCRKSPFNKVEEQGPSERSDQWLLLMDSRSLRLSFAPCTPHTAPGPRRASSPQPSVGHSEPQEAIPRLRQASVLVHFHSFSCVATLTSSMTRGTQPPNTYILGRGREE